MAVELPYILEAIAAILKLNLDEVQGTPPFKGGVPWTGLGIG